jgi:hypothetical protein
MDNDIVTRLRQGCPACGLHTLYACTEEAANEIELFRQENKIMADLLWHFMQNTDENSTANLSILHRAAKKLAIKGDD